MPYSTTPGSTVAALLNLPAPATDVVRWTVTDLAGRVVADGQQPPTGTLVNLNFVMPSDARVSTDDSPYVMSATDGLVATSDTLRVVSELDPAEAYNGQIAYRQGQHMVATLVRDRPLKTCSVTATLVTGQLLASNDVDVDDPVRLGDGYAYRVDLGVIDTQTSTTYGIGSVEWAFTDDRGVDDQEIQAFWTITAYSATFLAAMRKLVDRARAGDANPYLEISSADLANALVRGIEAVAISPPMLTPFALDQMPITLRDFIVKAGAVDLLRAQYLAEGMSAFDFGGEGVQLNVDRSSYIDALAQQLQGDLQNLPAAKKAWQQQGMPMGATLTPGVRPVGILALTVGTYSNFPVEPRTLLGGFGYSFIRGVGGLPLTYY